MSKAKDRARAESGIIFRSGRQYTKEEWYAAHPTLEMRAKAQASVDAFVTETMAKKEIYYTCGKCQHVHRTGTKIYTMHRQHARTPLALE